MSDTTPQPRRKRYRLTKLFLSLLLITSSQASDTFQSRESIRSAVHKFMLGLTEREQNATAEIKVSGLDPRLRLAHCDQPLETFLPTGGKSLGNTTVGVRCHSKKPWTLYVPTQIFISREILVSTRPLQRGEIVTTKDIQLELRNLTALRDSYLIDPAIAVGKHLKRNLPTGAVLTNSILISPSLIKRGEQVTVLIESAGIQVRASAKAVMDGALGETIRVRNITSKQFVEGIVVSRGVVQVNR